MGKGGYGLTYQEVYEMENLTIEAKAIYGMLCSYAGSKAMAYPSVDFICNKLKISRTRFYRHMNLLVGAGVVKKEQRKNENQSFSGNVYVLVPNLQNMKKPCAENIQMPYTENEHAGNASTGNEATNNNTINNNTTFRKQGRGLYIYSNTKGSGKTLLACCLANEVLKKQDVSVKFTTVIIDLAQLYGVHETLCVRIPESEEEGLLWSYRVEW